MEIQINCTQHSLSSQCSPVSIPLDYIEDGAGRNFRRTFLLKCWKDIHHRCSSDYSVTSLSYILYNYYILLEEMWLDAQLDRCRCNHVKTLCTSLHFITAYRLQLLRCLLSEVGLDWPFLALVCNTGLQWHIPQYLFGYAADIPSHQTASNPFFARDASSYTMIFSFSSSEGVSHCHNDCYCAELSKSTFLFC